MLCSRPSIKDVSIPRCKGHSTSTCNDPLSPRIGCMGQVKRNNKIAGFPNSSHRLSFSSKSSNTPSPVVKYSKLKKLFSGKNLISTPTTTKATNTITTCGTRKSVAANSADVPKNHQRCRNENVVFVPINIEEMDPPLPVIKRVPKLEEGSSQVDNSLWKRRSGGSALKSLQLQQIHHPRICLQPTSV
ncbi:hypothetical protein SESBI_42010 [Sesbania bispinosa]|nr:hypothetical protein SESBI_42010 [Sesbania bispinosa]